MKQAVRRAGMVTLLAVMLVSCNQETEGEPLIRSELETQHTSAKAPPSAALPSPQPNAAAVPDPATDSPCQRAVFESVSFTHCIADPKIHRIRTLLKGKDNQPYRSLRAYSEAIGQRQSELVVFAVNAGMFDSAGQPIGYFIEGEKRLNPVNRDEGEGNFYLKPNGIFFGSGDKWDIFTSEWFVTQINNRPDFATQSGPMIVTEGRLHPQIAENGPSRAIRNGVGIDRQGKAHFVISQEPVSFGQLARFFRDELGTPNALFLDHTVSALWDPASNRIDVGAPIGPMIVVYKRKGHSP